MSPQRIQRKRTKGWRAPEGAVYVGRGSRWGNPYRVTGATTAVDAVELFRDFLRRAPIGEDGATVYDDIRRELHGKDLMCWCALEDGHGNRAPCHADVLLSIANEEES